MCHNKCPHCTHAGSFSSAGMVESFVSNAGASLGSVTTLGLYIDNTNKDVHATIVLSNALQQLVNACPAVTSLAFRGHLSPALLRRLAEACPLLAELVIVGAALSDLTYLQSTLMPLLRTLLPKVCSAAFKGSEADFQLPDMSRNTHLQSLHLENWVMETHEWPCLPRTLQHLVCSDLRDAPPAGDMAAGSQSLLSCLRSLQLDSDSCAPLHVVAAVLRVTPALTDFRIACGNQVMLQLDLSEHPAAVMLEDLSLVRAASEVHAALRDMKLVITVSTREDTPESRGSLIARLIGLRKCELVGLHAKELALLIDLLPDVQQLTITGLDDTDNVELLDLAACIRLTEVTLCCCEQFSPMGILSLCQCCPTLQTLNHWGCPELNGPALDECMRMMQKLGLHTQVVAEIDDDD